MKLKKINNLIYHIKFDKRSTMCHYLVRFAEYYENEYFKGKVFSREEFKTWYKKRTGKKIYMYNRTWAGFNFQGRVINKFRNEFLYSEEEEIIKLFKNVPPSVLQKCYIIATAKDCEPTITLKHEIVHAMYDTVPVYRKQVNKLLKSNPCKQKVFKWLASLTYDKVIFMDEFNAYTTEEYTYLEREAGLEKDSLKHLSILLNDLYNQYRPKA